MPKGWWFTHHIHIYIHTDFVSTSLLRFKKKSLIYFASSSIQVVSWCLNPETAGSKSFSFCQDFPNIWFRPLFFDREDSLSDDCKRFSCVDKYKSINSRSQIFVCWCISLEWFQCLFIYCLFILFPPVWFSSWCLLSRCCTHDVRNVFLINSVYTATVCTGLVCLCFPNVLICN